MTDAQGAGGATSTPDPGETGGNGRTANPREWMVQLQSMIDNVATNAGPIMRDVAAKAAELAAIAGEKAGPIAHRAAEATEAAGTRLAERGREVATELRRDAAANRTAGAGEGDAPNAVESPAATPADRPPARDSADSFGE